VNSQVLGTTMGAAAVFCFFQPFIDFGRFYQSGEHFGGVAWALLLLPVAFATANWMRQKHLSMIFAACNALIALQYIVRIHPVNVAWGLWAVAAISVACLALAATIRVHPVRI